MGQNIKINYGETRQAIEGFGCFGGREAHFFADARRDDIMNLLFKDLQLSILRTEVKPSFSTKPGERNFDMHADLNILPNADYFASPDEEVKRRSQLWILKTAKQRYPHIKIVPSVWSPPYYMLKKNIKELSEDCYTEFANFLADYIEAYQTIDIPIFAMSPQNEPENIFSPWDVCLWLPSNTATFVEDHMKPVFQQRGLGTKIMVGESANWLFNSFMLGLVNAHLEKKQDVDILASHAYSFPDGDLKVNYDTKPLGLLPSGYKSTWITESCATTSFDPSMKLGLKAAICIHKFLTVHEVNAFIFWLGMVRGNSNEALVSSDGVGSYQLTKVYDIMGNYSRYVKEDYRRITTNSSSLASSLYVSAFKGTDTDNLSVIMINASDDLVPISIHVEQAPLSIKSLIPYITPAKLGVRWEAGEAINIVDGKFNTNLPPSSVTTFTSSS